MTVKQTFFLSVLLALRRKKKMVKKSAIYSPISLEAIGIIVKCFPNNPRILMTYIILARFAGEESVGGFGKNMVTGASLSGVSTILACRWERAKPLIEALIDLKIISDAPKGLKVGKYPATFVMNFIGDVQIPHALVDGIKRTKGISRLIDVQYAQSPEVIVTAIVALVHCYRLHDMYLWGGVKQEALHQDWSIRSIVPIGIGLEIKAERGDIKTRRFTQTFFKEVMASLGVSVSNHATWEPIVHAALKLLSDSGLIYEAVTIVDKQLVPLFPLRINDFFAVGSGTEASYIEGIQGAGYYTRAENPAGKPEGITFILPKILIDLQCSIVGLTRLRFRCGDPGTKKGLVRDAENINKLRERLIQEDLIDDLENAFSKLL